MRKVIISAFIASLWVTVASAHGFPADKDNVSVSGTEVVGEGNSVRVSFTLHSGERVTPNDRSLVITPVLQGVGREVALTPVIVRGTKATFAAQETEAMTAAGTGSWSGRQTPYYIIPGSSMVYSESFSREGWMQDCDLVLEGISVGESEATRVAIGTVANNLLREPAASQGFVEEVVAAQTPAPAPAPAPVAEVREEYYREPNNNYPQAAPTASYNRQPAIAENAKAQVQERGIGRLPRWNIKTNLLWDLTGTVNLGVELRLGGHTSLDVPFNYNSWSFTEERKWKHIMVQPELRLWPKETFDGHFFGIHAHAAEYNVGGLPSGPFSKYMNENRFEGWLAGAGVSYGYRWNFTHHWALEATIGLGYAYLDYDRFVCGSCGENMGNQKTHWFGPTRAGVSLIFGMGGKRAERVEPILPPPPPPAPPVVVIPYQPDFEVSYVVPETEAVKSRSMAGSAYLDFVVGRWEIVPSFRNNAAELRKIHTTIESVMNDSNSTLTGISITGYASPEGSWESNLSLSERRVQALKNHVLRTHGIPEGMFRVWGAGEDWAGLDSLVARSDMPEKYMALEIIRGTDVFGGRENRLMALAGGVPYRRMKAEMFPMLRRADYAIAYTVIPFTVEEGKQVFRSRPENLSLNEMFLIANTYEPGSDAFNEVFETAARIFSDSDTANINAAASALARGDRQSAARYLSRVKRGTSSYWNNMGVLAWLQGDKPKAADCFTKAGAQGRTNAAQLERHIRSVSQ
jgi:hypothetical protein